MRFALAVTLLFACREHAVIAPRAGLSGLRPRPHMRAAITGCTGGVASSDIAIAEVERDAPSVIVEEHHLHGGGPPSPTIALWDDGQVVFAGTTDGKSGLLVTEMSKDKVSDVVRRVYQTLERVPRSTAVLDISGGILMRITVRDGTRWRSAALYGDDPERVLAVARGTAEQPKQRPAARGSGLDFGLEEALAERPWPPIGFAKAYQQLVEAMPRTGREFAAHDYDVLFITPERGIEPQRPALEWPIELPRLPKMDPAACRYNQGDELDPLGGCRFMLRPEDNEAVERFDKAVRNGGHPRAVNVNGVDFAVRFDETYRGERTIDALSTCADVLASRSRQP